MTIVPVATAVFTSTALERKHTSNNNVYLCSLIIQLLFNAPTLIGWAFILRLYTFQRVFP